MSFNPYKYNPFRPHIIKVDTPGSKGPFLIRKWGFIQWVYAYLAVDKKDRTSTLIWLYRDSDHLTRFATFDDAWNAWNDHQLFESEKYRNGKAIFVRSLTNYHEEEKHYG